MQPHPHVQSLWQIPAEFISNRVRIAFIERAVQGEVIFAYRDGEDWCVFEQGYRQRFLPLGPAGEVQMEGLPRQPGDDALIERQRALAPLTAQQTLFAHCVASLALTQAIIARFAGELGDDGLAAALLLVRLEGRLVNPLPADDPAIVRFPVDSLALTEHDMRVRLAATLRLRPET